jgi:glutathione synthase/RimK-type ligase-like ATP-grasp enzyme
VRIAIVTARAATGTDEDEALLLAALAEAGASAEVVVWDDPFATWASYDLAVVRSTWDYAPRRNEFLSWARSTAGVTRLRNEPDVLTWNTDKGYLPELAASGIDVVPTALLRPGEDLRLPENEEFVVKPAVSAGSVDTARYSRTDAERARLHVRRLWEAGRTVLVQPYQASVDERGETALLFVDGQFSHAARKGALLQPGGGLGAAAGELFAVESMSPTEPTPAERALAEATLDAAPFDRTSLLYARVDVVADEDGAPLLLELELTEPSMFLAHAPRQVVGNFARSIVAAARPEQEL